MSVGVKLLSVEIVVQEVERSIELFGEVLGLALVERRPAVDISGEVVVFDAGGVAITLLAPAADGPGAVLADRSPRLSQLVFAPTEPDSFASAIALGDRAVEAGLAVVPLVPPAFFLTPECVAGALGVPTAVVVLDAPGE